MANARSIWSTDKRTEDLYIARMAADSIKSGRLTFQVATAWLSARQVKEVQRLLA